MLRCTHGVWGTTGISIGGKKSSRKCLHSASVQAKPSLCNIIKWCKRSRSAGHKKPSLALSNKSLRSCVYWPHGVNFGGFGLSVGKCSRGSPLMFLMILNFSANSPNTGLTLSATGLYFFVVLRCMEVTSNSGM